ncbi:MAG: ABC transporter permease [Candidatus Heimdallarchaeota archaeon]|nr:MAG: ABC transporter permease [Candidatus Heimdallarchaeota archaeon]
MIPQSAWIIAKKELKLLFKSTRRIFLLFTTPLILFFIFALMIIVSVAIISTIEEPVEKPVEILVIQDDKGIDGTNWGSQFYTLLKTHNLTKDYYYTNKSVTELNNLLESSNYSILLYIPANFTETINSSLPAQFYLYYNGTGTESAIAVSRIIGVSQILNQQILFYYYGILDPNRIYTSLGGSTTDAIDVIDSELEGFAASFLTLIPLYAIILLVIPSLSLVLISVTIEREQKTLESLILQPIRRKSIIAGKLLYGALLVGFNTVATVISIIALLTLGYIMIPNERKGEILPLIETAIKTADISVWIFLLFVIIGLILVSLLTITAAVFFSLMAKDEREANMVISALVIIPLVLTFLIAFLPVEKLDPILQTVLMLLPLLGYLFAIHLSLLTGEIIIGAWISLIAQLAWILIGVWIAGRLVESEGILEISYRRLFRRKT